MTALLEDLMALDPQRFGSVLRAMSDDEVASLEHDWREWAHEGQGIPGGDWRTWIIMAGRGFGKTRAGSAWVHDLVREHGAVRIALVAATVDEGRKVMVEGPAGLLATAPPWFHLRWESTLGRLTWREIGPRGAPGPGGAVAMLYSGASPESLRGPEHHFAWCDELAKWRHPDDAWDMLELGLRLPSTGSGGAESAPRALVTTTPRARVPVLKRLLGEVGTVVTEGPSARNPHVAHGWLAALRARLGDSRLGRQELDGVLVEDVAGTLWPVALLDACRGPDKDGAGPPPRSELARVVIGVDPPASAGGICGIVACGLARDGRAWVLGDHSAGGLSPEGWAGRVAAAAEAHGAERVIAETNQGGDMVRAVLRAADTTLPVRGVTARAGKAARAEPIAALFEAGRVRLAGRFAELEAQLGAMTAGKNPSPSPDRADAMVWALWALLVAPGTGPRALMP